MAPMAVDYYDVLGVSPDASGDEIKRAFRKLARENHPDATGNDPASAERYKQISEAYAVLSDPSKRQRYDAARSGFGASPFGTTIEDIFDSFFGFGGSRGGAPQRSRGRDGEDLEIALSIGFREAVFGAEQTLTFERHEACPACEGSGCAPGTFPERCPGCEGTGQVQQVRRTVLGSLVTAHPCSRCGQAGWIIPDPCPECRGAGRQPSEVELPIEIPPGIESGDRLRVRGEGSAGMSGGRRGDLYVRFLVEPDDRFGREGSDLHTWAEVPVTVAALGGELRFDSLDGEESLEIPAGTQSGEVFRIRGRGGVHRNQRGRGDLIVRVHVTTPTELDAEQLDLLRRLADLRGEELREGRGIMGRLRRALRVDE